MGQVKTEEKSNEITAIPELLKVLDIPGSIVTIDAMRCHKKIVDQIIVCMTVKNRNRFCRRHSNRSKKKKYTAELEDAEIKEELKIAIAFRGKELWMDSS